MLDLQSGNTHSYISYLKDIVDEECDLSVRAGVLMERLKAYEPNSENLTEKQKEVLGIWNNLSTNEQETVMSMLRGLRKQENSSSICIGCSFWFLNVKMVMFFLCTVEHQSIIKPVFLHKFKSYNGEVIDN